MSEHDDDAPPVSLDDARDKAAAIAKDEAPTKPKRKRAPRKSTSKRAPRADTAPRSSAPRPTALKKRLEDSILTLGALLMLVNATDGQLVIAGAPKQAAALDNIARENPAVRKALERMLTASVYGQLAAAFAPTLLGVAANHRLLPAPINGLVGIVTTPTPAPTNGDATSPDLDLGAMLQAFGPMVAAMTQTPAGGDDDSAGIPRGAVVGVG